ncbi:uncharacterized protein [Argopecten irradians]|uniref:uncharacterized protein n=1 Tax=Argopecten irradians TaxID=31199 RepID=UPI003718D4BC
MSRGGKRCVLYGCSNMHADGVSLHAFPMNRPDICKKWTQFVQKKRDKWKGPTKFSYLCSKHFDENAYPAKYSIMIKLGQTPPKKRKLNDDAVPTIQCNTYGELHLGPDSFAPLHQSTPKVKKLRKAFIKRERIRVALKYQNSGMFNETATDPMQESTLTEAEGTHMDIDEDEALTISTFAQTTPETPQSRTCSTQMSFKRPKSRTVRIQVKPHVMEKGCQTMPEKPKMKSVEVQCNILRPSAPQSTDVQSTPPEDLDLSWTSSHIQQHEDPNDQSYIPSESDHNAEHCDIDDEDVSSPNNRLLLVSECRLMQLFNKCFHCSSPALGDVTQVCGTMVKVEQNCGVCGYTWQWNSQPLIGSIPSGNLMMSCGILFSGSLPSKALRIFQIMDVACIAADTFLNHQRHYLQPAILDVWKRNQMEHLQEIQLEGRRICVGGDGRCDTPGHSAKYGSYSIMDLEDGRILDLQLVQSNEVKSSCHMEKEGLARSIAFLQDHHHLEIDTIVTDRHVQIRKWVRENMVNTKHCVDVWHVAKGLKKKLLALSKEKDCKELHDWIKSISNHLYWVAASTPDADAEVMWQKWASLENHVQDIHEGHGSRFPRCLHPDLGGQERRRKWLKSGSKSMVKLEALIGSRQMKLDIPMLSTGHQTSELEGYHSVVNHFAPKMHGFSFNGMLCRLVLAALHFNENVGRNQAVTSQGDLSFKITFPKHKKGGYTLREVKTQPTFNYVQELRHNVLVRTEDSTMAKAKQHILPNAPPPLCSSFERPVKEHAVSIFQSRFCHCE